MAEVVKVLEKWESAIQGHRWVNKFDPASPGKIVAERVRAGRAFYITPEERNLLNSDRIVDEKNDPFKNGSFRPVKADAVQEARDEEAAVAEQARREARPNPNHMTDDELGGLFAIRNYQKFKKAVSEITSEAVLRRLLDLSEIEEYDATVAMVKLIEDMIGDPEVPEAPQGVEVTQIDQVSRVGSSVEDRGTGFQPFKI